MKINKFIVFTLLFMPMLASAQSFDTWGPNRAEEVNLGTGDLGDTIAGIINVVLSFLGIIVLVGVVAGGFMYMTSGGNADQAGKGKDVLGASLIGLAIVVSAYAISSYILEEMYNQTVGTP